MPDLLRQHRLAAGLTQAELAAQAGVGVRTLRDLERGRSARPQRTTVELLAGALGLAGTARSAFLAAARGVVPDTVEPARPTAVALPAPPKLFGREQDVVELVELLTGGPGPRLVSLVGLAGVGKTALALSVARVVAAHYPGGVAGVLVGPGSDATDVLATALTVYDVPSLADLAARIADRPALLLVDAAERAPDPVAGVVHRLTAVAPSLRVLAAGRHPVGLPGERVWPVSPLEVPPPDAPVEALAHYPAMALFTARLAQARGEPPTAAELPAGAALVRRLGGLPLAIELMAARGRLLDPTELLDRYGDRVLDLTTDLSDGADWRGDNRSGTGSGWGDDSKAAVAGTLRDAVATSYHLLTPTERAALCRLAAFGNRWSVELAEEMLGDGVDAVPLLDRFLELGLLSVRGAGPFRFRLLDAVRDFAIERATGEGELAGIRRRHARVLARLVARALPELAGVEPAAAVRRLDEVGGDISAALAYAAADDPVTALRLASGLPRWWRLRGRDVAGRQWLLRLLADPRTADADPAVRAWALLGVARLAAEHGAAAEELPAARAAVVAFGQLGDRSGELAARTTLCDLLAATGAADAALVEAEGVLALADRNGLIREGALARMRLTWHDVRVGDLLAARRRLATVDRLAAQCGDRRLRLLARAGVAEVFRLEGRYADAVDEGRRVLAGLNSLGEQGHRVRGTVGLALAQDGRAAEAAEVLAELPRQDAAVALIEGTLALHRGDREQAAEWFAAAADAGATVRDRRDAVEALVGLAASTADPAVLDRLDLVCQRDGVRLLSHEEGLLYALAAARRGTAGFAGGGQRGGADDRAPWSTPRSSPAPAPPPSAYPAARRLARNGLVAGPF
ncbi:Predicted ATPase [Micromonospora nigra]|uniref:Predicted ATPase n=1 Tax=Micromonospora nigra TaxID=145857 RepID=A0A1C6S0K2_9ACTN|nr:Predicted ATPase [Micromonospora nigra]